MATIQTGLATLQDGLDGTCGDIGSKKTGDELEQKVVSLFDEAGSLPLSLSKEDGNIEVRTKFDGQHMTTLAEAKIVQHHPKAFIGFFKNFTKAFAEVDPMVKEVRALEHDNHREGIKVFLKFPFPVADRVMVHWKYLMLNRNKDEHLMIFSEKGNQNLISKHLTAEDRKKFVLGRIFFCAYWVKPVYDVHKNIVGSNIKYVFSGDVGGAMPKWVQSTVSPNNALNSLKGFIGYAGEDL